jgi:hypothetical protein
MVHRRKFITASAVAVVGATAGCSGRLDDIVGGNGGGTAGGTGGGDGGGARGVPALDSQGVLELLHAPGEFREGDHYFFSLSAPAAIDAMQEELDDDVFTRLVSRARSGAGGRDLIDVLGVDFWNVGTHYDAGPVAALIGEFSRGDVWRRLQYEGLQYQGNYNGFALIEPPDGNGEVTIAIEGEGRADAENAPSEISRLYVGESTQQTDSTTVVQTLIDVVDGAADRYSDAVDSVQPLVEGLSDGVLVSGETSDPVEIEGTPDANLEHEPIQIGQAVTSTLTAETTASVEGGEFSYMERYGFAGRADATATISASAENAGPLGIVLYGGNGSSNVVGQNTGESQAEVATTLPEDGAYNFVVYDPDQIRNPQDRPREYSVEVSIDADNIGGPESGVFEGEVARGTSLKLDTDVAAWRWVIVFENEPPMDDVDTWIAENSDDEELFGPYEEVTPRQDGNRVTVEGTIPVSEIDEDVL